MLDLKELTQMHSLLMLGPMDLERKMNIWKQLMATMYIPGDIVEIGCYKGATTALFRFLMNACCPEKELHVYDGFQGLYGNNNQDSNIKAFAEGAFLSSEGDVLDLFSAYTLRPPIIKQCLVQNMLPEDLPERISLALLDTDLYEPMKMSLQLVWPRLTNGAVLIIDDYKINSTKGVEEAVKEFFADKPKVKITNPVRATGLVVKSIIEWGNGATGN